MALQVLATKSLVLQDTELGCSYAKDIRWVRTERESEREMERDGEDIERERERRREGFTDQRNEGE